MEITGKNIVLRDYQVSDVADHIRWNTIETEWKKWDTPWVRTTIFDEDAYREKMMKKCEKEISSQQIRYSFEICCFLSVDKREMAHIGWMNAYMINKRYETTEKEGDIAIGIDIPEKKYRGQGFGKEAFTLFMDYLAKQGFRDIYTQTWSGNEGMISLAKSLGFTLCSRKTGIWSVDGKEYDGLTFVY